MQDDRIDSVSPAAATVYLGLGGNVGDTRSLFEQALASLGGTGVLVSCRASGLHETTPVGGPADQPNYLNAVVEAQTGLTPWQLLTALQAAEHRHDRQRTIRCGPRTLDLDLLFYAQEIIHDERLQVPHPRLHQRRFVLQPLAELCPDLVHPVLGASVRDLLSALPSSAVVVRRVTSADWLQPATSFLAGAGPTH